MKTTIIECPVCNGQQKTYLVGDFGKDSNGEQLPKSGLCNGKGRVEFVVDQDPCGSSITTYANCPCWTKKIETTVQDQSSRFSSNLKEKIQKIEEQTSE
jgi:hypothetical protein